MTIARRIGVLAVLALLTACCLVAGADERPAPVRSLSMTARQLHDLPLDESIKALPVKLRATVTYYDPYIDHRHAALFVEDKSGGIFVALPARPILPLHPGDRVAITGVTGPGDYASVIVGSQVRPIGHAALPAEPRPVSLEEMMSGDMDCQWVEIEGRVRAVRFEPHDVVLEIATSSGAVSATTVRQAGADYDGLIDSLVRLQGVVAPVFNFRRQMVGTHLYFPSLKQLKVVLAAPRDPYSEPAVPITDLFRFTPASQILNRVHVRGRVTLDWPGRKLCIEDAKDGICVQTAETAPVAIGTLVDVAGFPAINQYKPTLEDAAFRIAGPPVAPAVAEVAPEHALRANLDGQLVTMVAELIGQNFAGNGSTLVLRVGHVLFSAVLPRGAARQDAGLWEDGSTVRITGICNVQVDPLHTSMGEGAVRAESIGILLRSPGDIVVLHTPSWWTPRHAAEGAAAVGVVVLLAIFWIVILRHRVEQQTRALRASEERLRRLSEHDALTGLPNRILFNDRLRTSLERAARFKTCLGLLMVDADGFKQVNDELGHQAGDKLLCELAGRLAASVRATDTVARIGGDEFIVILPDLQVPAQAESIAAKIVENVSRPAEIDGSCAVLTVSIGVATYPEAGMDVETLMQCADEAMYAAKERGKNVFEVYRSKTVAHGGQAVVGSTHIPAPMGGA